MKYSARTMKAGLIGLIGLAFMVGTAEARKSGSVYGFSTSSCKTSSCSSKHPSGTYTHPLTSRKH